VIAISLACNPKLLIADEPTTALDVTIQAQVLDLMSDLKEKFKTAMVLITHDLGVVAQVCDKVAIMYAGEIIESGTLYDVYENTKHPYTIGLFGSIPNLDSTEKRLTPVSGLMPDPTNLPKGCKFNPRCPRVQDICRRKIPPVIELKNNHKIKCFFSGETEKIEDGELK
jgi:peptide/nickel transport system ATP-binding protein